MKIVKGDKLHAFSRDFKMEIENLLERCNGIVIKIGTAGITSDSNINYRLIECIAKSCSELIKSGKNVTIITSGAIALGRRKTSSPYRDNETIKDKQRYAAIGQPLLMEAYIEAFDKYKLNVGQFLLTSDHLDSKKRFRILKETYNELIKNKEIPIFNENDTIAVEEITFGDNDILAALITKDLNQDVLINLTVYDGLLKNNNIVRNGVSFETKDYDEIRMEGKEGRGGLKSKLDSAKIVAEAGKVCIISNIKYDIKDILSGKAPQTRFPLRERF